MKRSPQPIRRLTLPLILILAAVLLSACAPAAAATAAPTRGLAALPAEITVAQAAEKRSAGAFILDVRQPEEWKEAHIPGSTLIPLGELKNRLSELPKDKQIVVVCRSGNRSATGRDILKDAGFSSVTSMAGGLNQWKGQGLPTVSGP